MSGDRKPSKYTQRVVEQNDAPQLLTAQPVPRKATPVAMPAPPPAPAITDRPSQSHDDIEQVKRLEQIERERAELLAKLQDAEEQLREKASENQFLREAAPTAIFPPPSIPPPKDKPEIKVVAPQETTRRPLPPRLMRLATGLGLFVAIAWNAFNTHRYNPQKVDAVQARVTQSEREREEEVVARALRDQRTHQALRATQCALKQIRGALQRQGLDLQSLPAGGVEVVKVAPEDVNRPGPPVFIAREQCPSFPELPPEIAR